MLITTIRLILVFEYYITWSHDFNQKLHLFSILQNKILQKGEIYFGYDESQIAQYMKNEKIDITVDIGLGSKNFTVYTMDLTKKYIDINADYRS